MIHRSAGRSRFLPTASSRAAISQLRHTHDGREASNGLSAASWVIGGQSGFVAMMAVAIALDPSRLALRQGLSYYGTELRTIVPYSIGFAVAVGFTALGVSRAQSGTPTARQLRVGVKGILCLLALVPLSPYSVNIVFDWVHMGDSAMLYIAALVASTWMVLRLARQALTRLMLGVQATAGIAILLAEIGLHDYMIPSELAFQAAFTFVLARALDLAQRSGARVELTYRRVTPAYRF